MSQRTLPGSTHDLRRNSPVAMLVTLVPAAGGLLAITLLWWSAGRSVQGWAGQLIDIVFWTYVILRPLGIPLRWLTTTWAVDDRGVRFATGLLVREQLSIGWDEVVSVDISQPYLLRLFGRYAIRFGVGTTQKQAVRIDAVPAGTRQRIAALAQEAHLRVESAEGTGEPTPGPAAAEPATDVIYRIRPRDYLLISLAYGQFALFVPAVYTVVDQVNDLVPLPIPDLSVVWAWPPAIQLAALLGVVVLSLVYGWIFTWLRYRGFEVRRESGGYHASGGLLSSETRSVTARQVTGLKITQNPVMRALGYGRVSVLTKDAGEQPMANLLFPVVRLATLPTAFGDLPLDPEIVSPRLRMSTPGRVTLLASGLLGWAVLFGLAYLIRPQALLLCATGITLFVALVVNSRWVVASTDPCRRRCYARRGVFWVSHVEFDVAALHVLDSSQGLLGRLSRTWSVAMHYYDGKVRCLRVLGARSADRAALTNAVLAGPSGPRG